MHPDIGRGVEPSAIGARAATRENERGLEVAALGYAGHIGSKQRGRTFGIITSNMQCSISNCRLRKRACKQGPRVSQGHSGYHANRDERYQFL